MRNAGAVALARTGKTQQQIADELDVSRALVHYWLSGDKKPGKGLRATLRELYGIAEGLWDVEPEATPAPAPTVAPVAPRALAGVAEAVGGSLGMARELQGMAETQLRDLREDVEATALERARVMASLATTIRTLAQVTGDFEISRRLTKLPLWRRLENELEGALRGHPDAARAVADVFDRLEALEGGGS